MPETTNPPAVSVLLSTFNDEQFVIQAIESVLSQTLSDLELIVIDDGSTDRTPQLLESIDDSRLRILRNPFNIGLTKSLNKGLGFARGQYVARLDADCVALSERLERQVGFLERTPAVGIVGSAAWRIDSADQVLGVWMKPERDLELRWHSLLASPFIHSSVTIRSDVLVRNGLSYDEGYRVAQDYDLWVKLLRCSQGVNLRVPLVKDRVRRGEVSRSRAEQLHNHYEIAERAVRETLPEVRVERGDVRLMHELFVGRRGDVRDLSEADRLRVVGSYLDMLTSFLQRNGGREGAERVRRGAARRVAPHLIRCLGERGSVRALLRLTRLEPSWPILRLLDSLRDLRTSNRPLHPPAPD